MSTVNVYRCTPDQVREFVIDCFQADLVPFVKSSPGMGKSSIMKSIAKEFNLQMIDHRLSSSAPEDLSGLPRFDDDGMARFSPFADLFPIEDTPIPAGKTGWLLFLDEFNSAPKSVQAACYKLILDRQVGQKNLHRNVLIGLAGNLSTDRAITNNLSTAMQSRVIHLEMEIAFESWLKNVAIPENYDPRIIAYLSYKNSQLMDFRPDHNENTFCCPRTWEFMNRLVKDKPITAAKTPLYAGTITSGAAVDFVQFTAVADKMIAVKEILADPSNAPVPHDNETRWMVISHMMEKVTEANFDALSTYANRFDLTFRILFYRSVMARQPTLRGHPAFAKAMSELSRYLNG